MTLPLVSTHSHKVIGFARRISPLLRSKIFEFVQDGITNVQVIKRLLKKHVEDLTNQDSIQPHSADRAYYPLEQDVINCIHAAISCGKYSMLDQIQLEKLVEQWNVENAKESLLNKRKLYLRKCSIEKGEITPLEINIPMTVESPFSIESDQEHWVNVSETFRDGETTGTNFLFVHQEDWQQQLLLTYGNTISLLDATYKTTKYALPLFLLCVRTNCNYMPVAEFIIEREDALSIAEALKIIAQWNKDWNPPYFMIDYSEAELNGILAVFPNTEVYLCEFHREQAWTRCIRNGIANFTNVLCI